MFRENGHVSLFPEFGEDSTTQFHALEGLLGDLHVGVDGIHAGLDLLELLCKQKLGIPT